MPERLAWVGTDRRLYVGEIDGSGARAVTWARTEGPGWGAPSDLDACSWPCWSPDGRWISYFRGEDGGPFHVEAVEVDGIEQRGLLDLDGQLPIYAAWSPRGDHLALLCQQDQELALVVTDVATPGAQQALAQGVPLFFSWTPDGRRLLVHLGGADGANIGLYGLTEGSPPHRLRDTPGSFCTPVYVGARAVFVTGHLGRSWVSVADRDGQRALALEPYDGLVAVVPSPKDPMVAVGCAPRGEGTPYRGLQILPLDGGPTHTLTRAELAAFFWSPTGEHIVTASVDPAHACMRWRLISLRTRETRDLGPFWPSREQLFHLHFFEQFASSHPNISADGRTLVYSSLLGPPADSDGPPLPYILTLNLEDPDAQPVAIAEGSYGVFAPQAPIDRRPHAPA